MPSAAAEWIKDFGPPVAWLVAVAGLFINNNAANTREKRKEFRAEIDAIEKIVKDLVLKLSSYLKLATRDDIALAVELEIKVIFKELDLKWERLSRRQTGGTLGLYIDPCAAALERLYDHATGKHFETADRVKGEPLTSHLQEVYVRSFVFTEALHSLFLKKFDGINDKNL